MAKEMIVKMNTDYAKIKGCEYKRDLVRCEDCKYFDALNNDDHGWCKLISDLPIGVSVRYHDDYCSYAEER